MPRRFGKRSNKHRSVEELNITAFMNLMVVLVPFLLMTAVFTQLTVIELNLPPASAAKPANKNEKKPFQLNIIIEKQYIHLTDNNNRSLKKIPATKSGSYDFALLTGVVKQIKARYPKQTGAMILAHTDTQYEVLVHTMDAIRSYTAIVNGDVIQGELFPDISIGDAPKR